MPFAIRVRQLLSRNTRDLLWLCYVLGIAPWHIAQPNHCIICSVGGSVTKRQRDIDGRMELLRSRIAAGCLDTGQSLCHSSRAVPELRRGLPTAQAS